MNLYHEAVFLRAALAEGMSLTYTHTYHKPSNFTMIQRVQKDNERTRVMIGFVKVEQMSVAGGNFQVLQHKKSIQAVSIWMASLAQLI